MKHIIREFVRTKTTATLCLFVLSLSTSFISSIAASSRAPVPNTVDEAYARPDFSYSNHGLLGAVNTAAEGVAKPPLYAFPSLCTTPTVRSLIEAVGYPIGHREYGEGVSFVGTSCWQIDAEPTAVRLDILRALRLESTAIVELVDPDTNVHYFVPQAAVDTFVKAPYGAFFSDLSPTSRPLFWALCMAWRDACGVAGLDMAILTDIFERYAVRCGLSLVDRCEQFGQFFADVSTDCYQPLTKQLAALFYLSAGRKRVQGEGPHSQPSERLCDNLSIDDVETCFLQAYRWYVPHVFKLDTSGGRTADMFANHFVEALRKLTGTAAGSGTVIDELADHIGEAGEGEDDAPIEEVVPATVRSEGPLHIVWQQVSREVAVPDGGVAPCTIGEAWTRGDGSVQLGVMGPTQQLTLWVKPHTITSLKGLETIGAPDADLTKVEVMVMAGNPLTEIGPAAFACMPRLRELHLQKCSLTRLDEGALEGLRGLKLLDLSRNELRGCPPGLLKGCRLEYFSVSHNRIAEDGLPHIGEGGNLQVVDISHNAVRTIPATFLSGGGNACLRMFDASNNQLTKFPDYFISNASSLVTLQLAGNELTTPPVEEVLAAQNLRILTLPPGLLAASDLVAIRTVPGRDGSLVPGDVREYAPGSFLCGESARDEMVSAGERDLMRALAMYLKAARKINDDIKGHLVEGTAISPEAAKTIDRPSVMSWVARAQLAWKIGSWGGTIVTLMTGGWAALVAKGGIKAVLGKAAWKSVKDGVKSAFAERGKEWIKQEALRRARRRILGDLAKIAPLWGLGAAGGLFLGGCTLEWFFESTSRELYVDVAHRWAHLLRDTVGLLKMVSDYVVTINGSLLCTRRKLSLAQFCADNNLSFTDPTKCSYPEVVAELWRILPTADSGAALVQRWREVHKKEDTAHFFDHETEIPAKMVEAIDACVVVSDQLRSRLLDANAGRYLNPSQIHAACRAPFAPYAGKNRLIHEGRNIGHVLAMALLQVSEALAEWNEIIARHRLAASAGPEDHKSFDGLAAQLGHLSIQIEESLRSLDEIAVH